MDNETKPYYEDAITRKHWFILITITIFLFVFPIILHTYSNTNEFIDLNKTDNSSLNNLSDN